jgi:17beta-estradiol 17-dehydrogenase / very-long-chain 3-oxoacyl-CoA reductase
MLAPYAASKKFLASFCDALGAEVKSEGVDVEAVNTYFVVSNMSKIRKSSVLIPTPKQYVKATLNKVGLACGALFTGRPHLSTPYWSHALLDYFIVRCVFL